MKRMRIAARCPWCEFSFGEDQKRDFWAHVYSNHGLSTEDVLFEVSLELESVKERLEQIEKTLAEPRRRPSTEAIFSRRRAINEVPERHPESYY